MNAPLAQPLLKDLIAHELLLEGSEHGARTENRRQVQPTPSEGDGPAVPNALRAVFVSDIHLGTAGCQAEALLAFLRDHEADTIYLVGDIVDAWALKRRWFWPQAHNDVIQKLLRKARKGTRVVYIPGNHDEAARQFGGLAFGGIEVVTETVHVTADGRRLWVVHGDEFDGVMRHARWLAHLGDRAYTVTLWLNRHYNRLRHHLGQPYWSLSQYLKHKVKNAVSFISNFEQALAGEARRRGFDGVVCGHIHRSAIHDLDGILYCNDGDWVESLTALVETHAGELQILHCKPGSQNGEEFEILERRALLVPA
ncbi:MAG: UDP-2,3-diacylglucosamine diphosphatase [Betaproteobacteria bacterium]|nr:UDP-2,3-diacylglucosamine diphosphatase [Betaproteobacteria bacterium]